LRRKAGNFTRKKGGKKRNSQIPQQAVRRKEMSGKKSIVWERPEDGETQESRTEGIRRRGGKKSWKVLPIVYTQKAVGASVV